MTRRLANSYREDDLRRASDWRRQQATMATSSKPAATVAQRTQPAVRALLAAICRLVPRFA
jgi:hypothetical protein